MACKPHSSGAHPWLLQLHVLCCCCPLLACRVMALSLNCLNLYWFSQASLPQFRLECVHGCLACNPPLPMYGKDKYPNPQRRCGALALSVCFAAALR